MALRLVLAPTVQPLLPAQYDFPKEWYRCISLADLPPLQTPWCFPAMFKQSAIDKTLIWQIGFDGVSRLIARHGYVDGIINPEPITVTCNLSGRNMYEQSLLDARHRHSKKFDLGYREPHGLLNSVGSQERKIDPMLAHDYNKCGIKDHQFPVGVQLKLDGVRAVALRKYDTEPSGIRFISRNGKEFPFLDHLEPDLLDLYSFLPINCVLDGEIFNGHIPGQTILGMVKSTKKRHESLTVLEYFIFDVILFNNTSYIDRYRLLVNAYISYCNKRKEMLNSCLGFPPELIQIIEAYTTPSFSIVYTTIARNMNEIQYYHSLYTKSGHEGLIIRLLNAPYEFKRSKGLLKYKTFDDDEATIVDVQQATGNQEGNGILVLQTKDGVKFNSTSRGTFNFRKRLLIDRERIIGRVVTFRYQGKSEDSVPRFPVVIRFRDYE
jgi:hypothetical protein